MITLEIPMLLQTPTFLVVLLSALTLLACKRGAGEKTARATEAAQATMDPDATVSSSPPEEDPRMTQRRQELIDKLKADGIEDPRVLEAMNRVPRHELVPERLEDMAYLDRPLPIGEDQTISQPYIVALMSQAADIQPGDKVLEIGTGSGYQGAVLAQLTDNVYTIEIVEPLARRARADLERLGYASDMQFRIGDGYAGWPEAAPFDAIIVTAAPPEIPEPLKQQLAPGGRLVIPVGDSYQELRVLERRGDELIDKKLIPVRFVPMTGEAQERNPGR